MCETGLPNMRLTITNDGGMGIAPSNQAREMRSLDFWRLENGLIRENWVLIDLLDIYRQIGINIFVYGTSTVRKLLCCTYRYFYLFYGLAQIL